MSTHNVLLPTSRPFFTRRQRNEAPERRAGQRTADPSRPAAPLLAKLGLRRAPNAIQWAIRDDFLGQSRIFDIPKHFEVLRDMFELLCPNCNDVDKVKNCDGMTRQEMLSQVLLEYGRCPRCGVTRAQLAAEGKIKGYNELALVVGMRSGKTWIAGAYIGTYLAHTLLCLGNVSAAYGLPSAQMLEMIFVAVSEEQARSTIWSAFSEMLMESQWFRRLAEGLQERERDDAALRKGSLYVENTKRVIWRPFRLRAQVGHSNSASLAGGTRVYVAIDELAKFDLSTSKRSADEVYTILAKSLSTVQGVVDRRRKDGDASAWDLPDPIMACVSSPMTKDDKIMRLLKEANEQERMYAMHKATWEFNPLLPRDAPIIQRAYEQDAVKADRDYGARPSDAINPLITDPESVELAIDYGRKPIMHVRETNVQVNTANGVRNYVAPYLVWCLEDKVTPRILTIDAGEARDAFALAVTRADYMPIQLPDEEAAVDRWVTVVDAVVEVRPVQATASSKARHVHFPSTERFIENLIKKLNITHVAFDRWNSTSFAHALEQKGVSVSMKNVLRDDYILLRSGFSSGLIRLLPPEHANANPHDRGVPQARAIAEILKLEDSGTRVDHPPNFSKDLADTICKAYVIWHGEHDPVGKRDLARIRMSRAAPFGSAFRLGLGSVPMGVPPPMMRSGGSAKLVAPPDQRRQLRERILAARAAQGDPPPPGRTGTVRPFMGAVVASPRGPFGRGMRALGPNDAYRRSKIVEYTGRPAPKGGK